MKNSVLIIGLDGADWKLLKPWMNNGELPTLKKLCDAGASGDLRTTIPLLSFSTWTSFFTGKNPAKHSIFETRENGIRIDGSYINTERIWNVLSRHGKRCGVINVPMTYPLEELNGYMVSSLLTPPNEKIYSYPPEVMSVLEKHNYKIRLDYYLTHNHLPNTKELISRRYDFLEELNDMLGKRCNTYNELINENWDFFMAVFDETAVIQQLFRDKKNVMLKFFKKIDFCIGELIKTFSIKNAYPYIFIVSDHGFSDSPARSFNIRVWLEKNGFLKDSRTFVNKIIPKIYNVIDRIHLTKLISNFKKVKVAKFSFQKNLTEDLGVYFKLCGIHINKSQLNKEDYEELRNRLMKKIMEITEPSGEKIFKIVEKRETIYFGKYIEKAPDIITLSNSKYNVIFSYDSDNLFEDLEIHIKAKHISDIYGIFLANGNKVNNVIVENASILDIFPTVLNILDVPLPNDIDGRVLEEILK